MVEETPQIRGPELALESFEFTLDPFEFSVDLLELDQNPFVDVAADPGNQKLDALINLAPMSIRLNGLKLKAVQL